MVIITQDMALNGSICPVCKEFYKPNGTGPDSSKLLSAIASALPGDEILRYGSCYHDWAYHLGPAWGTRKQADDLMYQKNKMKIEEIPNWVTRYRLHVANWRNYLAVRMFGGGSYNEEGCKACK